MKKYLFGLLLVIFLAGCSKYQVIDKSASQVPLKQYKNIYVGWLDLDETKWQVYRYESVDKWKVTIHEMNVLGLQKSLKERLPGKTITGDTEKSNDFPAKAELYIKSTVIKMEERKNLGMNILPFVMTVLVQFYDVNTKKELFHSTVNSTFRGSQWMNIESNLDAIVYNFATYLAGKLNE